MPSGTVHCTSPTPPLHSHLHTGLKPFVPFVRPKGVRTRRHPPCVPCRMHGPLHRHRGSLMKPLARRLALTVALLQVPLSAIAQDAPTGNVAGSADVPARGLHALCAAHCARHARRSARLRDPPGGAGTRTGTGHRQCAAEWAAPVGQVQRRDHPAQPGAGRQRGPHRDPRRRHPRHSRAVGPGRQRGDQGRRHQRAVGMAPGFPQVLHRSATDPRLGLGERNAGRDTTGRWGWTTAPTTAAPAATRSSTTPMAASANTATRNGPAKSIVPSSARSWPTRAPTATSAISTARGRRSSSTMSRMAPAPGRACRTASAACARRKAATTTNSAATTSSRSAPAGSSSSD